MILREEECRSRADNSAENFYSSGTNMAPIRRWEPEVETEFLQWKICFDRGRRVKALSDSCILIRKERGNILIK